MLDSTWRLNINCLRYCKYRVNKILCYVPINVIGHCAPYHWYPVMIKRIIKVLEYALNGLQVT